METALPPGSHAVDLANDDGTTKPRQRTNKADNPAVRMVYLDSHLQPTRS